VRRGLDGQAGRRGQRADLAALDVTHQSAGHLRLLDRAARQGQVLVGDIDCERAWQKASLIAPVPGGVGPMTITMLLYNTLRSAERTVGIDDRDEALLAGT
jgi:methylenetetrahydrofolate dehydrogenase (NADP+)/methenyltetrahydrofolate cyclohydrolase